MEAFFGVNTVLINLTISQFTAILAVSAFVIGPIADRYRRRRTLLPGLILYAAGSLVCLWAGSYVIFGRACHAGSRHQHADPDGADGHRHALNLPSAALSITSVP